MSDEGQLIAVVETNFDTGAIKIRKPTPSELAAPHGYAAGDKVEMVLPAHWTGTLGSVHWCNGNWVHVYLPNGHSTTVPVSWVKRHTE